MSKFYLPTSTPASTTNPSPLNSPPSPNKANPLASPPLQSLPHRQKDSSYSYPEDDNYSDDDDLDTLPYPAPLPRSDFLQQDFNPQSYLSTLGRNRHQTLEDLRSDLRSRSALLSRELLDLVNNNYEEFLSLGSTLKGGDERVESLRVGVLGFQRAVEGVREGVAEREREVRELLEERRGVRREILLGRKLLGVEERLGELEGILMIEPVSSGVGGGVNGGLGDEEDGVGSEEFSDEEDDEGDEDGDEEQTNEERAANAAIARLRRHAQDYLLLQHLISQVGADHPFVVAQEPRLTRVRNTLLLDLRAALRQARKEGAKGGARVLRVASIYRALGEGEELVGALKSA